MGRAAEGRSSDRISTKQTDWRNSYIYKCTTNVKPKRRANAGQSGSNSGGENFMQTTNKLAHSNEHMRLHLVASVTQSRAHTHTHEHTHSDVNQIYLSVNLCSWTVVAANAIVRMRCDPATGRPTDKHTSKRVNCTLKTNDAISGDKMCASKWSNGTQTMNGNGGQTWSARVFVQNIWTIVIRINVGAQMRSHHVE